MANSPTTNSLAIEGIDAGYGAVKALRGVSLNVESGETVALLGTNGNGKSTLMKCVAGLVRPQRGSMQLTIDDTVHDLTKLSPEAIVDLGVAMVPEGRRLFPKLTVLENLMLGAFRKAARRDIDRDAVHGRERIRRYQRAPPADDIAVIVVVRRLYQHQLEAPCGRVVQHSPLRRGLPRTRATLPFGNVSVPAPSWQFGAGTPSALLFALGQFLELFLELVEARGQVLDGAGIGQCARGRGGRRSQHDSAPGRPVLR